MTDSSREGLMSTESPEEDTGVQSLPKTLPSEKTVEHRHASGMKRESQTLNLSKQLSKGDCAVFEFGKKKCTSNVDSCSSASPMESSSTVDGGDESVENDKANSQEMGTQEPQAPSSPQPVPMDIKDEGGRLHHRSGPSQGSVIRQDTTITRHNTRH